MATRRTADHLAANEQGNASFPSLIDRRELLAGLAGSALLAGVEGPVALAQASSAAPVNLARVALPSSFVTTSENKISALNDGALPRSSGDRTCGRYAVRREEDDAALVPWVEYAWSSPVSTQEIRLYWAIDPPRPNAPPGSEFARISAPASYRLLFWSGSDFVPVSNPHGLGLTADSFNITTFDAVTTNRLRLEITPAGSHAAGILEWVVSNSGPVPPLAPVVAAGLDRSVILGSHTFLAGHAVWLTPHPDNVARWSKSSGPGAVTFADASAPVTTARFSAPGEYTLTLTGSGPGQKSVSSLHVHVEAAPPRDRLDVVYTTRYSLSSPLWSERAKTLIVDWIPHCIAYCERVDITPNRGDGGIDNFLEAGKANRGELHAAHRGYVFSNAWVHQTVESICIALMIDAQGDPEILQAQQAMHGTLDRWIPIILAAQMPDGYLQTAYILADRKVWPERWSPDHRGNHEGYVSGYFIESAINHYTLTEGQDLRLYNAAKKLADCWVGYLGPNKKPWFDGHQEMEQALVRFGRFVNDQEGHPRGDAYIRLAKFLLDSRRGGSEYDQSHLPPEQQYEAVGHAVRATYFYSGMADIAAETGDPGYQSAVLSLWDNMVNKKFYLTGGIGSGETSEGFGPDYSLRNNSYCESCSSCGLVFFQYKLNLAYHDAKYADLYEQTIYNALLGGVALDGKSFCYTNPLVGTERTRWHVCPCCVGNIPRTLLMVPTWTYAKSETGLYVNLFIGSRIQVGKIAGTHVEMIQKTDYPWQGDVAITVNPAEKKTFTVHVRVPNRTTSKLYSSSPELHGIGRLTINGHPVTPWIEKGYVVLTREWQEGDQIAFELPLEPQRITADSRIKADLGAVALQYGPLIYNVESADQGRIDQPLRDAPLHAEWRPDLLGGVVALTGTWQDGSPMLAIPNYTRMNRVGQTHEYLGDPDVNYAPGATTSTGGKLPSKAPTIAAPVSPVIVTANAGTSKPTLIDRPRKPLTNAESKVWI